ncbi:hypothetical protein HDU92_003492 [Lobulomyces angularis]|nr:hypothetical protein HDU92_003492 [Lobulomyces angularis]
MHEKKFLLHNPLKLLLENRNLKGNIFNLATSNFILKSIKKADETKIPFLKHDLHKCINSRHRFFYAKKAKLTSNIAQPDNFHYDRLPPYVTASKDETLLNEAVAAGVKPIFF